jgi:hypothetical protein
MFVTRLTSSAAIALPTEYAPKALTPLCAFELPLTRPDQLVKNAKMDDQLSPKALPGRPLHLLACSLVAEGEEASRLGIQSWDNPYPADSEEGELWLRGWSNTRFASVSLRQG